MDQSSVFCDPLIHSQAECKKNTLSHHKKISSTLQYLSMKYYQQQTAYSFIYITDRQELPDPLNELNSKLGQHRTLQVDCPQKESQMIVGPSHMHDHAIDLSR